MNSPVIKIDEDESVVKATKLMVKHKVGSIIVINKNGKPLGIITEKDLVERVVAENTKPSEISTKKVMTSPLITVKPKETVTNAAKVMNKHNIRKLAVIKKGDLIGIVSNKDILLVVPGLLEILQGENKIESIFLDEPRQTILRSGCCDDCGEWSDILEEIEGNNLCEECRDQIIM